VEILDKDQDAEDSLREMVDDAGDDIQRMERLVEKLEIILEDAGGKGDEDVDVGKNLLKATEELGLTLQPSFQQALEDARDSGWSIPRGLKEKLADIVKAFRKSKDELKSLRKGIAKTRGKLEAADKAAEEGAKDDKEITVIKQWISVLNRLEADMNAGICVEELDSCKDVLKEVDDHFRDYNSVLVLVGKITRRDPRALESIDLVEKINQSEIRADRFELTRPDRTALDILSEELYTLEDDLKRKEIAAGSRKKRDKKKRDEKKKVIDLSELDKKLAEIDITRKKFVEVMKSIFLWIGGGDQKKAMRLARRLLGTKTVKVSGVRYSKVEEAFATLKVPINLRHNNGELDIRNKEGKIDWKLFVDSYEKFI